MVFRSRHRQINRAGQAGKERKRIMRRATCCRDLAVAAALFFGVASMAQADITLTTDPTALTISKSILVAANGGIPVSNAAVEAAVSGLTPIKVTLKNTNPTTSATVRINPVGAGSHIQLWAKNSDSNWLDINVTGWLGAGYALPAGFDRTIDVYAISDAVGAYPLTVNLVKVSDSSLVAFTTGEITVNDPLSPPQNLAASDGTYTNKVLITWNVVSGATSYEVWRNTSDSSGTASKISSPDPTGNSYEDTSAVAGTTYYYWVKAANAVVASSFSAPDSGFLGVVGPLITANGLVGEVNLNSGGAVTVAVQMMNIEPYLGAEVDWWVVAFAHSGAWYYMDSAMQWQSFSGDLAFCRPVYQGPLFNVPSTPVLNGFTLPSGTYDFWFAVDYPMDGILNLGGPILFNCVTVVVQ